MKVLAAILLFITCCACVDTDSKTRKLNQRVTRLEQRIDSLTNTQNRNAGERISQPVMSESDRCKGITKKGTQCKRKAKTNGYCWQHGGQ